MIDMYGDDRAYESMYSGVRAIQASRCDAKSFIDSITGNQFSNYDFGVPL